MRRSPRNTGPPSLDSPRNNTDPNRDPAPSKQINMQSSLSNASTVVQTQDSSIPAASQPHVPVNISLTETQFRELIGGLAKNKLTLFISYHIIVLLKSSTSGFLNKSMIFFHFKLGQKHRYGLFYYSKTLHFEK